MSTKENNPGLLSKMAKFVRNPTTNWTDLDKQDPEPDNGYSKQALKEMIERKRQNDFVRKREFDQLRRLRSRDPSSNPDLAGRPSYFQSSLPSNPDERAMTIKKIDEIEAQMSNQWWQGKNDSVPKSSSPTAPGDVGPSNKSETTRLPDSQVAEQAYAPTRLSPMKSERKLSGGEASDFPPTQDNSEFGPHVHARHSQAAGPPSGVANEAGYRQAPPDTKNRRPFAVELTDIATDAELEEAAIRFANGDDAGAQAGLLSALENDGASREQAQSWALALLDLYRATGQQQPFELVSLDYARRFGRSAPIWFSMPEMLGLHHASAVERTVPSILVDEPTWCCPAQFGASEVDELRLATANVQAPWFLDWSDLTDIDTGAVDPLGALFAEWCATPVELHFAGTRELEAALRALAPSGDRSVRQANWKLRLDAQRIMQSQDEFELIALDYCVTYEVSPPPWVDARCGFRREDANGSAASRSEDNAAQSREPRPSATVHMGLESLHAAVAELSGEVVGEATEVLDRLEKSRSGSMNLVVSCTNLVRVDFSAAGSILNWVANLQADGCQVQFRDVHRLVAAFFSVIGINEHARILMRSS